MNTITKLSDMMEDTRVFLQRIAGSMTEAELAEIIQATTDDIRFNIISFGKTPDQETVNSVAVSVRITLSRCPGGGEYISGTYSYQERS